MTLKELREYKLFVEFLIGIHKGLKIKEDDELADVIDNCISRLSALISALEVKEGIIA